MKNTTSIVSAYCKYIFAELCFLVSSNIAPVFHFETLYDLGLNFFANSNMF